MRVKCLHGFYIFQETRPEQVSDFVSQYQIGLSPFRADFTFDDLVDAPLFTIKGGELLDAIAIKTFEGEPWDVFEANEMVYDFTKGLMVPIQSITLTTTLALAGGKYISPGLLLAGQLTQDGDRVQDFSGWYSRDTQRWVYTEVTFV